MEIFRALASLAEAPDDALQPLADALELGPVPSPSAHLELFSFQLFPYASVYLGVEGMMGGDARDRVAGFWRVVGQVPPPEPDHLVVLLAAYAELCEREAEGDESPWRRLRSTFLWEHLLSWLPLYLSKVPGPVGSGFYTRWAHLLNEALKAEVAELGLPPATPVALEGVVGLANPQDEGADALIGSLLAPARAGFVLTREDLHQLADGLGLGLRAGERRFALTKLFGQDPVSVLNHLADHAATAPKLDGCWGPVTTAWHARRQAAEAFLRDLARSAGSVFPSD